MSTPCPNCRKYACNCPPVRSRLEPSGAEVQHPDYGSWTADLLDAAIERWTGKTPTEVRGVVTEAEELIALIRWYAAPFIWVRRMLRKVVGK